MSRVIMDKEQRRKPYSVSLPPLLVAQVDRLISRSKDKELVNRSRSRAFEILLRRGMKAGR